MTASDFCAAHEVISCQAELSLARRGPSTHEKAPVHHAARQRGGRLAARGAGAAGRPDAAASDPEGEARVSAFQNALQQLGWTDGRNVLVDIRSAGDSLDRIKVNVAELVGSRPDVIVVAGNFTVSELQRQTTTILVFTTVSGSVESGFVASLSRPEANITGFQNFEPAIAGPGNAQRIATSNYLQPRFRDKSRHL